MSARNMVLRVLICLLPVVGSCSRSPAQPLSPVQPLTPAQQMELKTLIGQLADPARTAKTKREAAELLLSRTYPQAAEAVRRFLADPGNRLAQIAVAQAIAAQGRGRKEFINPLMKMLTGQETSVRAPAAQALATYKDHGVTAKLVEIATDRRRDRDVRLVTIGALQRVLDKEAVDALVGLLSDGDEGIRNAAASALAKLTNIRAFGNDAGRWQRWWRQNKNKARSEWLADLADSLGRANAALEAENARLRERLAKAMVDLYTTTPAARRVQILLGFLKDPLADVRLMGVEITDRRIAANESVSEDIRVQVRTILADADPRVRQASALLTAALGEGDAVAALLKRLQAEDIAVVRQALLTALGQLRDSKALPSVLKEIDSQDPNVSAAAAAALARIAAKTPLEGPQRASAVQALVARYQTLKGGRNGVPLQEALLTAMGVVGDKAFVSVLRGALGDPAAMVRLAAVNALATLGDESSASALAGMADDPDRGVRQAAIAALGRLGGTQQLQTILKRTDPAAEADPAVRKQAWEVGMAILAKADAGLLRDVLASLAKRDDAADQRIRIMQLLVDTLTAAKADQLPDAQRDLGQALRKANRPAEAAPLFAAAWETLRAAKSPKAKAVWLQWVDALLAAADVSVVKVVGAQADAGAFATALARLQARLAALSTSEKWPAVIGLASAASKELARRLGEADGRRLAEMLKKAQSQQAAADGKRVAELAVQLTAVNESARRAAVAELGAMGDRAVKPLVAELKKLAGANKPNVEAERAVLAVLAQIAPKLTGYDLEAGKEAKLKTIRSWGI